MNKLRIWQGFFIFAFALAFMFAIASPLQYYFGNVGLAATELCLLAMAVGFTLVFGADASEVFPFSLPKISSFFASAILFVGVYLTDLAIILIVDHFFPAIADFSESIVTLGTSMSPWMSVFVIAFLPALCEESLFRGIIMSCFRQFKSEWITVILTGLLFGIMHLDPYRLLSTSFLGMGLAYISLKTKSMVLNILFHFCVNLLSVVTIWTTDISQAEEISITPPTLLFSVIYYSVIGIILIVIGKIWLDRTVKEPPHDTNAIE